MSPPCVAARVVALCADDYGLAPAISHGILDLALGGRISALSCLVTGADWAAHAQRLPVLPAAVAVGLHFNLTQGEPASTALRRLWPRLPTLPRLMAAAALRRLPLEAIGHEWRAQWARFLATSGRAPAFIDGHQHVHHLPGVREIVLQAAQDSGAAVRNTGRVTGPGFAIKRWLIEASGGRALQAELARRGVAHNAVLCGVYDFAHSDYRALMQRWLAELPAEGSLLLCHPARSALSVSDDATAPARLREAAYLGSAAFTDDLAAAGVSLGAAWAQRPSAR
jgi:chitin disaccharide deacetylase